MTSTKTGERKIGSMFWNGYCLKGENEEELKTKRKHNGYGTAKVIRF